MEKLEDKERASRRRSANGERNLLGTITSGGETPMERAISVPKKWFGVPI